MRPGAAVGGSVSSPFPDEGTSTSSSSDASSSAGNGYLYGAGRRGAGDWEGAGAGAAWRRFCFPGAAWRSFCLRHGEDAGVAALLNSAGAAAGSRESYRSRFLTSTVSATLTSKTTFVPWGTNLEFAVVVLPSPSERYHITRWEDFEELLEDLRVTREESGNTGNEGAPTGGGATSREGGEEPTAEHAGAASSPVVAGGADASAAAGAGAGAQSRKNRFIAVSML